MNRCKWCGTGVPNENMLCEKCLRIGMNELGARGKPEPGPCIKCGRVDTGGHSMCQSCFDSLTKAGKCMECGGHTVLGTYFCPECRQAMDEKDRAAQVALNAGLEEVRPDGKKPCVKCGGETINGNTLCSRCFKSMPRTLKTQSDLDAWLKPVTVPAQDKSLIWEDCPACAAKHLAASYAAVTSPDCGSVIFAPQTEVLVARALIAIRECESGYSGNAALAAGCLALAETLYGGHPDERKGCRNARLKLLEGDLQGAEELLIPPSLAALAAGHIAEALRELPELADRTCIGSLFSDGNFEPDTAGGLRDWLRESIGWIMKTHELGVGE